MKARRLIDMWFYFTTFVFFITLASGCQFYPYGEYLRFIRVPENTPIGEVILQVEVHPRHNLSIQPLDRIEDATYFAFRDINSSSVGVILYKSLETLVDSDNPQNVLKFRMACDFNTGAETVSSYMSVTVYVEDINDHAPIFLETPYEVTVDELTPVGMTLFRGIHATDRDKPNTPNSDVHYAIVSGNENGHFSLESSNRASLILSQPLDYDAGDKEFLLKVMASDRGSPPRNTTVPLRVFVADNDDLSPVFTREVYKTQVNEFYPLTGRRIHHELRFKPALKAFDADLAINAPIRYDIISGNERHLFSLNPLNGTLYLDKEVDLDKEKSLPGNTFVLQVQASQTDNPLRTGLARLEIEFLDLNDNLPEFEVDLYNISIVENLPNGFSVLQVIAVDKDQLSNLVGDSVDAQEVLSACLLAKNKNQPFSDHVRKALCDQIIRKLTPTCPGARDRVVQLPTPASLCAISETIEKLFPCERASLYFQSGSAATHFTSRRNIHGDLVTARERRKGFLAGLDIPLRCSRSSSSSSSRRGSCDTLVALESLTQEDAELVDSKLAELRRLNDASDWVFLSQLWEETKRARLYKVFKGDNGEFSYQLEDPSLAFNIDSRTGWLTVRDQTILDRERQASLSMKVFAKEKVPSVVIDKQKKSMISSVMVEVTLLDANDNNPTFLPSNLYEFRVPVETTVGDLVGQVKANDPDLGRNGMVLYALQRSNTTAAHLFTVDAQTGHVRVAERPLVLGRHALFIEASDQPANPSERRFSLAVVTIEVVKAGRSHLVPDFVGAPYEFWVGGDVPIGTSVGQIRVTEAVDKTRTVFDLLHSYHEGVPFAVEEKSGVITVVEELKKFDRSLYDFEAVVTDEKDVNLVTNATIHVVDPQDVKSPFVSGNGPFEFRVRENQAGALVGHLLRSQSESLSNSTAWWKSLKFIIANQQDVAEKFAVSSDGSIYTQRPLDREERDIYRLIVIAENSRGVLKGAGIYQVSVIVDDENDNAPIFDEKQYEGHIAENSEGGAEVQLKSPVTAKDVDSGYNAQFKFTLYGEGSDLFVLDQATGRIYLKKDFGAVLDREEKSLYNLRIVARDKGNLNSEVKLIITVDDVNDNSPKFLQMVVLHDQDVEIVESGEDKLKKNTMYITRENNKGVRYGDHRITVQLPPMISLPENIPVGTLILRLLADDKDSNSTVTYSIIEESFIPRISIPITLKSRQKHFMVHTNSGEVAVAASLSPESEYRLTVSAEDAGGLSDNVTVRIYVKDVNDHAPVFLESSYDFELLEGEYENHWVGKVETTDADYDENANVSYSITNYSPDISAFPFRISPQGGEIFVDGDIDREVRASYVFRVTATDQARVGPRLSSSISIEVHVQDKNDNSPVFFGYDRLMEMTETELMGPTDNSAISNPILIPVYYTSVNENSGVGTVVARVFANDTDFTGNGNGLILFDIAYRKGSPHTFEIDSKEGVVTVMSKLDYEVTTNHNITIIASDLGEPSLSSTALLVVNVLDVPEEQEEIPGPMFTHRYYEVEVEENVAVPLTLLKLNVSDNYKGQNLRFGLIPAKDSEAFSIDPKTGKLVFLVSPDRETKARYEVKIRADRVKRGREMIYPPPLEKLSDVGPNEVKIVLRVKDVNDNSPRFKLQGRPMVAAIPTTASYGYEIVTLKAVDQDEGLNADIRYQILGRADDDSHKFAIDSLTGQVRSVSSFLRDAGKVYGFDVKATDRKGADNGRSAIANVFVYVLDDQKQVVLILGSKATVVERNIDAITSILHNATGLDIRVRKIEPHMHAETDDGRTTDLYLYAVDPLMNTIINMDMLQQAMEINSRDLKRRLDAFRTVEFSYLTEPPRPRQRPQRSLLSALEVAVVVLGCVVFVGALAAAVCVGCVKRGKRAKPKKAEKTFAPPNSGFTLGKMKSPHLFPGPAYLDSLCPGDTTDTYVEMHSSKSGHCGQKRRHRHDPSCHRHHHHHHRRQPSAAGIHFSRSNHTGRLETSLTSLHSSGKDSGITEGRGGVCPCGHSTSHSSGDSTSNGSYEDSLKSLQRRNESNLHQLASVRRSSFHGRARPRQQPAGPPPPPPAPARALPTPIMDRRF